MAIPSYLNVVLDKATSTFGDWFERTKSLSNDMATKVVTAETDASGGSTTGNVSVVGIFSANTLAAGEELRGGTVTTPGPLNITSNTNIDADAISINTASVSVASNTFAASSNTVTFTSINTSISGNTVSITGTSSVVIDTPSFIINGDVTANNLTSVLDFFGGITANASELNILDGVTANTSELNILDGVTANTTQLNYTDISQLGVSEASKVVTADANGDVLLSEELKAKSYNETYVELTSSSNATVLNCEEGNSFSHTLTENTTFTFVNPPSSGTAYMFSIELIQDASASGYTVEWPDVKWPESTAPTISSDADAVDILVFFTRDGGTTWYGNMVGRGMA